METKQALTATDKTCQRRENEKQLGSAVTGTPLGSLPIRAVIVRHVAFDTIWYSIECHMAYYNCSYGEAREMLGFTERAASAVTPAVEQCLSVSLECARTPEEESEAAFDNRILQLRIRKAAEDREASTRAQLEGIVPGLGSTANNNHIA